VRKSCWRSIVTLTGLVAFAVIASLLTPSTSSALFMRPDLADTYTGLHSYYPYVDIGLGTVYDTSSYAIDASGDLWVAHNERRGDDVLNAGLAVYHPGDTTAYAFFPLNDHSILGMDFGPDGNLYLSDLATRSVLKYSVSTHTVVQTLGEFGWPGHVHVNSDGDIFVVDEDVANIGKITAGTSTVSYFETGTAALESVRSFGLAGNGDVIVGDSATSRLVRFSAAGVYMSSTGVSDMAYAALSDVYVDGFGTTYVLGDYMTGTSSFTRIKPDGSRVGSYPDPLEGTIQYPSKLAIDSWGSAWINNNGAEVQRYSFTEGVTDIWPPQTADDASPNWVKGPATLSLNSTDTGNADVASIYYSLDGSVPSHLTTGPVTVSAEGTTTLKYFAVDRASNVETTQVTTVRVDNGAPTTLSNAQPMYYGAVQIDLSATDSLSGVKATYWSLNNGETWNPGTRISIPSDTRGDFRLIWYSVDNANNVESQSEYNFSAYTHYEQTAPQITYRGTWGQVTDAAYSGGTYARSQSTSAGVFITFSGNIIELYGSRGPNLGKATIKLDNGTAQTVDLYSPVLTRDRLGRFVGAGNGTHTLAFEALDTKNILSSGTSITVDSVDIGGTTVADTIPPVTTDDTYAGWYNANSLVTLFPTDNTFVAYTQYRIGSASMSQYLAPFKLTGNGTLEIQYRSQDGVGNTEATKTATVQADTIAPSSTATIAASYVDSATISLSATDNLSGVSKSQHRLDGGSWVDGSSVHIAGYGLHTLDYRALDVAGNVEATKTAELRIRRAVETYTISSPELNFNGSWGVWQPTYPDAKRTNTKSTSNYVTGYGRATNIQLYAYTNDNSGIARINLDGHIYWVDQYSNPNSSGPVKIWDSGIIADTDHFFSVSYSGYKNGDSKSPLINVQSVVVEGVFGGDVPDHDPPSTTSNIPTTWTASPYSVSLTQVDYLGNEGATFYDVSQTPTDSPDATTLYEDHFSVATDGVNYVSYYSVDLFGNQETIHTDQLKLDSTPPTTTSDIVSTYSNAAHITLTPSDPYSGVAATYHSLDGGPFSLGTTVTVSASTPGPHTLRWYSRDAVGNVEAIKSATFTNLVRYEDEYQSHIEQEGLDSWKREVDSRHSAELMRYAYAPGALAGTFTGDRFDLISAIKPYYGIARIVIDGQQAGMCDQYSPDPLYQQRVFSRSGLGAGVHTFRVEWTGTKNEASTGTNINIDAFELIGAIIGDTEPPVTEASPTGAWRTTPETVTFNATDNGVVAPFVRYTLNGGLETLYTTPFEVNDEGTTSIDYWATDGVGNEEVVRTAYVRIDRTAPSVIPSAPTGWVRGPLYAMLDVTDAGCGVDTVVYSIDGTEPSIPYSAGGICISAEGTTTVRYRATDNLGNSTGVVAFDVKLDRTLPTTRDNAATTWVKGTQYVSLSASDTPSGVASMHFSLDGIAWGLYSIPIMVSGEGTHTVNYHSHDWADNQDSTRTATILIDNTAPVSSSDAPVGWQRANVTVHLTATDALAGLDKTYYSLDGSVPSVVATSGTVISTEGTTTLKFFSVDKAGNAETVRTATIRLDKSTPSTTDDAPKTWVTAPVTVHLTATDTVSGVSSTRYSIDGATSTTYTAAGFGVSAEGTTTITYSALDVAGNRESTKTAQVRIDRTAPVTGGSVAASYVDSATITLIPVDAGSGVASTTWRLDGGQWATGTVAVTEVVGPHTIEFSSTDAMGNSETTKSATFTVLKRFDDTDARILWRGTWKTTTGANYHLTTLHYLDSVNTSMTAMFNGTGFDLISFMSNKYGLARLSIDGGAPIDVDMYRASNTYKGVAYSVRGLSDTTHTVNVWRTGILTGGTTANVSVDAIDVVGTLVADTVAPTSSDNVDSAWRSTTATVSLAATDGAGWGVTYTHYRVGAGVLTTYTAPFSVSAEGTTTIEYRSTDAAGNVESTKTATVRIDRTAPSVTNDAPSNWVHGPVSLHIDATDTQSGIASIVYSTDDSTPTIPYGSAVTVSSDGTTTVRYTATDKLGYATSGSATVRIDNTAPVSSDNAPTEWIAGTAHVTLTSTDALSGVSGIVYSLDGSEATTYAGPIAVSGEGTHYLNYAATDVVGNVEGTRTATMHIDDTAPITTCDAKDSYVESATISISPVDSLSGVATTEWRVDGGTWTSGTVAVSSVIGTHILEYRATDTVGNTEPIKSATFAVLARFDNTDARILWKPTWKISANTLFYLGNIRYLDAGTTTMTAMFKGTGFDLISFMSNKYGLARLSIDGGAPVDVDMYRAATTYKGVAYSVRGLSDTTHTVNVWRTGILTGGTTANVSVDAIDVVGTLVADTVAPTSSDNADSAWRTTNEVVSLTATDGAGWGVSATHYRANAGVLTTYSAPFTISAEGTNTIEYRSTDAAGNVESTKTAQVRIDRTAPGTTDDVDDALWHEGAVTVTLSPSDAYSGVASTSYRIGNGALTPYTGPFVVSAPGVTTVTYSSVDRVGNTESTKTATVKIDGIAPTTTDNAPADWRADDVVITLTANDAETSVALTQWRTEGAAEWTTYSAPFTISAEGTNTIEYRSTDAAGNVESTKTAQVRIDRTAPGTTDDVDDALWHEGAVTVTLSPSDAYSGVASTSYRIGNGALTPYTGPFVVSAPGVTTVTYSSVDRVGNTESTKTATVKIDGTAPTTTSDTKSSYVDSATITLTPTDTGSGVSSTSWRIDDGPWNSGVLAQTALVGAHTLQWSSTDVSGNSETTKTATFTVLKRFDDTDSRILWRGNWKTSPSASFYLGGIHYLDAGTTTMTAMFKGTGIDLISFMSNKYGLARLSIDGGAPVDVDMYRAATTYKGVAYSVRGLSDTTHTVNVWRTGILTGGTTANVSVDAIDVVGTLVADTVAPTSSDNADSAWRTTNSIVSLAATDGAGWGVTYTHYRVGAGVLTTYTAPFSVSAEGTTTIEYRSTDAAGNVESTKTATVRIDRTAPSVTNDAPSTWVYGPVSLHIDATDTQSGIASIVYSTDDSTPTIPYSSAGTVSSDGTTTVRYTATDKLGYATSGSATVRIDNTVPVSSDNAPTEWIAGTAHVTLTSTDALSGVSGIVYSLDGSEATTYAGPIAVSGEGTHYLNYAATDVVGNVEGTRTATMHIDDTAPVINGSALPSYAESATIVFSATDGASGVSQLAHRLNGGPWIVGNTAVVDTAGTAQLELRATDSASNVATKTLTFDVSRRMDDNDSRLLWKGTWKLSPNAAFYLGQIHYAESNPATMTLLFKGTGFDLISFMSNKYGLARVSVDGGTPVDVDMYRRSTTYKGVSYSLRGLSDTTHTVEVWRVGMITGGTSANVSIDAIDVVGGAFGDTTPPITTSDALPSYLTTAQISLNPTDTLTSVASTKWRLDGGTWLTGTSVGTSMIGSHTLEYYSTDAWGNTETTRSVSFDVLNRYDDADSRIAWDGTWKVASGSSYNASAMRYAESNPTTATFAFRGTGFDLISFMSTKYGLARIRIDGGTPVDVDMYRPAATYKGVSYSLRGLSDTTHTVEVWRVGTITGGTSANVSIDAIDVVGTLAMARDVIPPTTTSNGKRTYAGSATVNLSATDAESGVASTQWRLDGGEWTTGLSASTSTLGAHTLEFYSVDVAGNSETTRTLNFDVMNRYDDADSRIVWDGKWSVASGSSFNAGAMRYSESNPATATFAFKGTGFDLISLMTTKYGLARVRVDGGTPVDVDMYRLATTYKGVSYSLRGLSDTTHTVEVWRVGTITGGTSANVSIDAIDVIGTLALARDVTPPSTTSDAKSTYQGSATVNLSAADAESGVAATHWRLDGGEWSTGLSATTSAIGPHTLEFYSVDVTGNTETTHSVSFDVMNRYDDADSRIGWDGTWKVAAGSSYNASAMRYAESSPTTATFAFTGTGFDLISFMSTKYGLARVRVDGGTPVDVDMYRLATTYKGVSYSLRGLSDTSHTVEVWRVGSITGGTSANVSIDAIDVIGTLQP